MGLLDRLKHAWNAFVGLDPPGEGFNNYYQNRYTNYGQPFSYRPDKITLKRSNEKSVVGGIYTRIAVDCSSIIIRHVKLDDNDRYHENFEDDLDSCLCLEANKDQSSKAFIRDVVISLFDEGCVAIVPIDTTDNPEFTDAYDIQTMRVGKIVQ